MRHAPLPIARIAIAPDPRGGWRMARGVGPDPAQVLIGRAPEEAARLVPLIFNLCGAAHGRAAAMALGRPTDPVETVRRMAQETARDHARAILIDWPQALGLPPERESLGLIARPDGAETLIRALTGDASELADFSLADLAAWLRAGETGTARLLARLRSEVDPKEGRRALPMLSPEALVAALDASSHRPETEPSGEDTCATEAPALGSGVAPQVPPASPASAAAETRPPIDPTQHFETGALARTATRPLLAALLASEGPSLFVRLLARLVDGVEALRGEVPDAPPAPSGIGLAEAARGLLGHRAKVADGRVAAYAVLSPSAWNLAPGGLLERAFAALSPQARSMGLAPLLISAINPCVPVSLTLKEAAYA